MFAPKFSSIFLLHSKHSYMTSYGYIIMVIVDSWMIRFHFDCIMQLKIKISYCY